MVWDGEGLAVEELMKSDGSKKRAVVSKTWVFLLKICQIISQIWLHNCSFAWTLVVKLQFIYLFFFLQGPLLFVSFQYAQLSHHHILLVQMSPQRGVGLVDASWKLEVEVCRCISHNILLTSWWLHSISPLHSLMMLNDGGSHEH